MPTVEQSHEFIKFIQSTLISLRRTLDFPYEALVRQREEEAGRLFRSMLMDLESARLLIAPLRAAKSSDDITQQLGSLSKELSRIVDNPEYAKALKAAFAVLRSMENLISIVYDYCAEFGQKTISKTIDSASSAASKVIVITLLTMALGSAASISPVANKVPEMTWLRTATEIVKKQLEKIIAEK